MDRPPGQTERQRIGARKRPASSAGPTSSHRVKPGGGIVSRASRSACEMSRPSRPMVALHGTDRWHSETGAEAATGHSSSVSSHQIELLTAAVARKRPRRSSPPPQPAIAPAPAAFCDCTSPGSAAAWLRPRSGLQRLDQLLERQVLMRLRAPISVRLPRRSDRRKLPAPSTVLRMTSVLTNRTNQHARSRRGRGRRPAGPGADRPPPLYRAQQHLERRQHQRHQRHVALRRKRRAGGR